MNVVRVLLTIAVVAPAYAAEPQLPRDGWVSWQAAAVEQAPAWCCFGWNERKSSRTSCRLDADRHGFGISDGDASTDTVTVYARQTGGKLDRLQVLAAACPVETRTPIQARADVSQEDSARWLVAQANKDGKDAITGDPLRESALAALAMHRGGLASDAMSGFAHDPRVETRKQAVFWASMVRGSEGAELTSTVMFSDQD